MNDSPTFSAVAEVQGLYGAFIFSERLLQKIWLRREFSPQDLRTNDGRTLLVLSTGKWNRMGGPDFKDARLKIGDEEVRGDVELHLREEDWAAHRHAEDAAYERVVLHVILFPTEKKYTQGVHAHALPVVSLLANLSHGLEEYAADDAVEILSGSIRGEIFDELSELDETTLCGLLRAHAIKRWKGKLRYAQLRIERLGWTQASHVTALEILGFRFNRAPMLNIATMFPLEKWQQEKIDTREMMAVASTEWRWQGMRPANHPRTRLDQYARWTKWCPDWPAMLAELAPQQPAFEKERSGIETTRMRRELQVKSLRTQFERNLCGNVIGGSRLDTLICDGFLPLMSVHLGRDFSQIWFHWFVGDMPDAVNRVLRELGVFSGPSCPACHGFAQGLLGWMIEREALKSLSEGLYRGGRLDNT